MKKYKIVVADPPWEMKDKLPGKTRGAARNYNTMSMERLAVFPGASGFGFQDDAILFMWRLAAMAHEADTLCRLWGFKPKSEIVWVKTSKEVSQDCEVGAIPNTMNMKFGMGRYVRNSHEVCLIATRGKASKLILNHSVRSVFFAGVRAHSQKPEEFFEVVERLTGAPRQHDNLELFARERRLDWSAIGDQLPEKS